MEEVAAATGFELDIADDLRPVPPPREDELAVIRSLDRLGVRRSEFGERELTRRYRWSDDRLACAACT